jgi:hypothetical protein
MNLFSPELAIFNHGFGGKALVMRSGKKARTVFVEYGQCSEKTGIDN